MVDITTLKVGNVVKVVDRRTNKFALGYVSLKTNDGVIVKVGFDEDCIVNNNDERFYVDSLNG